MKAQADRRRQLAIKGHGKYEEIFEEKQFFAYAVHSAVLSPAAQRVDRIVPAGRRRKVS
jgi:hypothetical protein